MRWGGKNLQKYTSLSRYNTIQNIIKKGDIRGIAIIMDYG